MADDSVMLQRFFEEREIMDLLHRYTRALDTKNWNLLATCFAPDAIAIYGEEIGRVAGVDAIVGACRAALERLDSSQHILSNFEFEIEGNRATARSYVHAQHTRTGAPGGDNFVIGGIYSDDIIRAAAGWRIQQRELRMLWREGNPAVLE